MRILERVLQIVSMCQYDCELYGERDKEKIMEMWKKKVRNMKKKKKKLLQCSTSQRTQDQPGWSNNT